MTEREWDKVQTALAGLGNEAKTEVAARIIAGMETGKSESLDAIDTIRDALYRQQGKEGMIRMRPEEQNAYESIDDDRR